MNIINYAVPKEKLREEVLKYKDHPALLAWGIGNELNLQYKNPKVWNAVNDIAKMIHEVDPLADHLAQVTLEVGSAVGRSS